jgi:RimJ/RimL family protein N-acetyltransferase
MIQLSPLPPGQQSLDELARFVGELNCDQTQQIGYLDDDPAQIAKFLAEHDLPPHQSWVVAHEDGRMVGALGFEADGELGRAWIYGPFVRAPQAKEEGEHPTAFSSNPLEWAEGWRTEPWAALADRLWNAAQVLLPSGLREHELFYNIHNTNGIAFAARHGFPEHGDALILRFGRELLASLAASEARELAADQRASFQALHDQIFPQTYYSGRQILERVGEHRKVFAIAEGGELLGYTYVEILPEFGEGNLEFIGVSEQARGKGIGNRLLTAALRWMFGFPSLNEIFLTTNTTNTAAIALYQKVGFQLIHTMRAFRKTLAENQEP